MKKSPALSPAAGLALALSLILNFYFVYKDYLAKQLRNPKPAQITAQVVRVVDGDTFDLAEGKRVRLRGAAAPEFGKGCLGDQAKMRLEQLISGQTVKVEGYEEDSFGRQLAYAHLDSLWVDETMIEEGLAEAVDNQDGAKSARLLDAQDRAKGARRGIWSEACRPEVDKDCLIKGNVRRENGTRIYHLPECYNYQKIVISTNEGDQWFCSEKEARTAGFLKSQDCPESKDTNLQ